MVENQYRDACMARIAAKITIMVCSMYFPERKCNDMLRQTVAINTNAIEL